MLFALILAAASPIQALPPAAPTAPPASQTPSAATPAPGRPRITWDQGQLTVEAQNSSLNTILREISLRTGMKIDGGVQDERVFGTYGPASASIVLHQLLIGTKCNMLLQVDAATLPFKLTLTPLTGGVSPPNPMQSRPQQEETTFNERQQSDQGAPPPPPPQNGPQGNQPPPQGAAPDPASTQPTDTQSTSSDSTDQSQNGVKTPQQILEQLQKLRSQQK